jgi:hypothetical protein
MLDYVEGLTAIIPTYAGTKVADQPVAWDQ